MECCDCIANEICRVPAKGSRCKAFCKLVEEKFTPPNRPSAPLLCDSCGEVAEHHLCIHHYNMFTDG